MLFPDLGDALISLTEDTPDDVGMACQPCPQQLTWLQRAPRQPQGQGGREKEKVQVFEPVCRHVVCAMKCGGAPSQPTFDHQTITARHQC